MAIVAITSVKLDPGGRGTAEARGSIDITKGILVLVGIAVCGAACQGTVDASTELGLSIHLASISNEGLRAEAREHRRQLTQVKGRGRLYIRLYKYSST